MRKLKEQAKKICNKNGGDFKLGMVLASVLENSTISQNIGLMNPTWSMGHAKPFESNTKFGNGKIKVD